MPAAPDKRPEPRCTRCAMPLLDEDELHFRMCERCLDVAAERSRERAEWGAFHDEPCPEVELTPWPKSTAADIGLEE